MTNLFNRCISVVMTAVMLLAGCSTDALHENLPDGEASAELMYIRLQLNLQGRGIPGSTRASEGTIYGVETPGTPREDAVNTVDLLICDAANDLLLNNIPLSDAQIERIFGSGLVVPVSVPEGTTTVHIYAAVNMTDRMRRLFRFGEKCSDLSLASDRSNYRDVIDEFVPGSAGKQETFENCDGSGIPMTGQFTISSTGSKEIEFTQLHSIQDHALPVTADVSRIVAKIHVLTQGDGGYAHSTSGGESIGWIHQSDVRYLLNGTNKSTYIFPQPNDREKEYPWKDTNMNLEDYLTGGIDLGLGFNAPAWVADYVFYNGLSLHQENISAPDHLAQAETYDQTRYELTASGSAEKNRYTRGIYCLENYFNTPTAGTFASYEDAIPMVTHVSIAAKLTPRWIVVIKDYAAKMNEFIDNYKNQKEEFLERYGLTTADFTDDDVTRWNRIRATYDFTSSDMLYRDSFRIICAATEDDAADIINWSLKVNNLWSRNPDEFENNKYPDGTFYVYDMIYDSQSVTQKEIVWNQKYLYLSAGAVASATTENIDIKTYSVPHLGGWGYYYTYLDQLKATHDGKTPYTASQVTRNTYYLVTVGNFGAPGGSVSRPEYIRVNTEPVGWDYDGRGDIKLY